MSTSVSTVSRNHLLLPALRRERYLVLPLAAVAVLFALQQSGLGILDYLPELWTRTLQAGLVACTLLMALVGAVNMLRMPALHRQLVFALVGLNVLYGVATVFFGGVRLIFHLGSISFALAVIPMLADSRIWIGILRGFFWCGMALIVLNTVTLAHWAGWVELEPETIRRLVDADVDLSHLDPASFWIFGRTENHTVPGWFFARLQGWALEPLHWGYFAVLILCSGLMLREIATSPWGGIFYGPCFALIGVHLFFIHSMSVFVTLAAWFVSMGVLAAIRLWQRTRKREAAILFFATVIGTGFVIPFALALVPEAALILYTEEITGKGTNWASKIGFLDLGAGLFTRFVPSREFESLASHNLILERYIHYGYFLVAPLLGFLYWFVRHAVSGQPFRLAAAALLALLCHLMLVPSAAFYPSGVLFFALAIAAAYYTTRKRSGANAG